MSPLTNSGNLHDQASAGTWQPAEADQKTGPFLDL